jgi:HAD superfamily hydrolase (TIGR01509 family)
VVSAEIGYSKPDPAAFEIFFKRLNVDAKEAVFIDDSASAISRVSEIGLTPILFTDYASLMQSFKALGISV